MLAAETLLSELAVGANVRNGQSVGITHAAEEDGLALHKAGESRAFAVVPFAGDEGAITEASELRGPGRGVLEIRINIEQRSPAHDHGSRRHADGALHRSHAISTREGGAAPCGLVGGSEESPVGEECR